MASIEELDDRLGIIKLRSPRKDQQTEDSTTGSIGPLLPKEIDEVRSKTFDERFAELNRIPLFMRELDETDGADGENVELEALKMLAHDGEPWENASSCKENGNDCYKARQYGEAVTHYSNALALKCGRDDIDETCYANRAACNLELQNYGKVMADCKRALKLNPKNIKVTYRFSKACIATDRLDEAQELITRGLLLDPTNKSMKTLLDQLETRLNAALRKRQLEDAAAQQRTAEERNLAIALKSRHINITRSARPPDVGDAQIRLSEPDDPLSSLVFPTVFLYPLTYQSDFLSAFPEVYTLQSQLELILEQPPEWDNNHIYTPRNVECYMATNTAGLIKVGKKSTLGSALGSGKVNVHDGVVRIFVVPKTQSAAWIVEYKKEIALTGGR